MATKNLIPRGSGEGGLGISETVWGHGYFDTGHFNKGLYISGVPIDQALDEAGVGGKWEDGANAGDIYYNGGNVAVGSQTANEPLRISSAGNAGDNVRLAGFEVPGANGNLLVARIMGQSTNNSSECQLSFDLVDGDGLGLSPILTIKNNSTISSSVTINSDNVGIGTENPVSLLHIASDDPETSNTSANARAIMIQDTSLQDDAVSLINFITSGGAGSTQIGSRAVNNVASTSVRADLFFATRDANDSLSEKLTIKADGRVGIGTTSPDPSLRFSIGDGTLNTNEGISLRNLAATWHINNHSQGDFQIAQPIAGAGANVALTIKKDDGNVGIGTDIPTADLEIKTGFEDRSASINIWCPNDRAIGTNDIDGAWLALGVKNNVNEPDFSYSIGIDANDASSSVPKLKIGYTYLDWDKPGDNTLLTIDSGGDASLQGKLDLWPTPANGPAEGLTLNNYAYSDSTDESVYIEGKVKNGDQNGITPVGRIVFGKEDTYATPNQRDGNIQFHTYASNSMHEAMRIRHDGSISFKRIPTSYPTEIGFLRGSSSFGTCDNTDVAISWAGVDANNKGATDLVFGCINSAGNPQEIAQFGRDGGVRIGRRSQDSYEAAQQAWGYLDGGSLIIWDEHDRNAALPHLKIVGGSGSATAGSHYLDNNGVPKYIISQDRVGGEIHMISSNNGVKLTSGATSWVSASSDRRSKENISPLENVLDQVLKLSPSRYDYKEEYGNKDEIGFIAQDVEEVLPDFYLPGATEEEMSTVKFSDNATAALLVKAIQEQNALIEDLKSRIETLENK